MKLDDNTLEVLTNFAAIQPNIVISEGSEVKTMAEARNILATAKLNQEFPRGFGIYDLPEFLSTLSLVEDPDLTFNDTNVEIRGGSGRSKVRYFYSSEDLLTSPTKDLNAPPSEVSFTLDESTLRRLRTASATLKMKTLCVEPTEDFSNVVLSVRDTENDSSNFYSVEVPATLNDQTKFQFVLNMDNIKVMGGDYTVALSSRLLSVFTKSTGDVVYYIAMEKTSSYGE